MAPAINQTPYLTFMREILNNIIYTARRFKLATTLNIIGLIVAFASFFLLLTQIGYQLNYNHGLADYERLYRLESNYEYNEWDYSDNVCRPFAEALRRLPQFESFSLMRDVRDGNNYTFTFLKGKQKRRYDISWCNETALSTVTNRLIHGRLEWKESDSASMRIIPASIAMDYFGTTHAAGKQMTLLTTDSIGNPAKEQIKVIGVYEDFPENCELSNCIYGYTGNLNSFRFLSQYKCYVKFSSPLENLENMGDSIRQAILADLDDHADEYGQRLEETKEIISKTRFKLTPLDSSYFEYTTHTSGDSGFKVMLTILELACLLIIIIATINFLNFTLAESPLRMRSVNTRLVLGANRRSIRTKLIAECVFMSVVTCMAGLAICDALSHVPIASLPLTGSLAVSDNWGWTLFTLAMALVVGVAAGTYPAIFATSFPPALVLKGSFGLTPQGRKLRTVLVCLQLFITFLLVIYIGILLLQSHHIINSPYGYDKSQLFYANLKEYIETPEREELEQELMLIPDVESVTFASTLLGATDAHYMIKSPFHGRLMGYNVTYIDYDFMSTMGIKMVEGRDFTKNDTTAVIINETARRQWSWLNLGDHLLTSADDDNIDSARVVGVCKDIRYGTLHVNSNQPFVFILEPNDYMAGDKFIVRVTADCDKERTRQEVDRIVQNFKDDILTTVLPYDSGVADSYHNEFRFFSQVYLIALFCMLFTLIGLFCMTMFETEYRRKEIGIRKVAGATTGEIVWMLCRHYGWLILLCFAVAAPLAWYFGDKTLSVFAERAHISWWIYPMSLVLVGGIMLGVVALQGWLAARKNPASTIKTE